MALMNIAGMAGLFTAGRTTAQSAASPLSSAPASSLFAPSPTPADESQIPAGRHALTYREHTAAVKAVAWSPDGKLIASGDLYGNISIWRTASGETTLRYTGHSGRITALAWSPDGRFIASSSASGAWSALAGRRADYSVHVWHADSGKLLCQYTQHTAPVTALCWSPDGKQIASTGDDMTVRVWQPQTGNITTTHQSHRRPLASLAWSPDGKPIISSVVPSVPHAIMTHGTQQEYSQSCQVFQFGENCGAFSISWSPDEQTLALALSDGRKNTFQISTAVNEPDHSLASAELVGASRATRPLMANPAE
ncbi:MAG: PD40 domain-containing protein [Ktedonobacteraceae bacterium]|nr:PD40 domain-containing protein [Ktedonobacteraceae bacterium]